jgi:2,4-dienoyl-CoA reductase-like NADH-dependent reductase (Old Yellow Enzyme family)/thioredoxin reductase
MSSDPLFSEFRIKNLVLKNRIVSTPHEPAYSEDGLAKDRYRAYHVEKAKGGVGMTMTAGSALVSRESAPAFGNLCLWKDETVPWLRRLTDEVHEYGTACMIQLSHMGMRSSHYQHEWIPVIAASSVREQAHRSISKAAERFDMDRIKDDYISAAQKMVEAGMDGLEIYLAGHFLDSFLTPFTNYREDEYGGSLENRIRYPLEIIKAVRAAVPADFVVGTRMTFDEGREVGLNFDEAVAAAQIFVANGIDYINGQIGSIENDYVLSKLIPVMGMPSAPHLEKIADAKRKIDVPFIHAAKIADVPTARYAIEAGLVDLVGMTRAMLADPYLVTKIREGREDEIRPCVGASMCIDGIYVNGAALCIHNPSTGREIELPQVVDKSKTKKKVAVIGGGPGGLEAARVLCERGHEVTLFEANDRLGGQLALAALAPRRRDLQGIIDWRAQEIKRLGGTIKLNSYVEADDLSDAGWDVVIVATGGLPRGLDCEGAQLATESWDVLAGAKKLTGDVIVFDEQCGNQSLDAVEAVLRTGGKVEFVTPERSISPDVGGMVAAQYFATMNEQGVKFTMMRHVRSISKTADGRLCVQLGIDASGWTEERIVDAVVVEAGTNAMSEVYDELVAHSSNEGGYDLNDYLARRPQTMVRNPEGKFQLFRIGDAVASRNVHAAIFDANRLCQAI